MKVCTDACVFGAWINRSIKEIPITNALDIGSGTGLLSLMMAQENTFPIQAIEVNEAAFFQTQQNFEISPWLARLQVQFADAISWNPAARYQLICCNPPFFKNDLPSINFSKRQAMHEADFTLDKLIALSKKWLTPNGYFALLMPWYRLEEAQSAAVKNGFFLLKMAVLKRNVDDNGFRAMMIFCNWQTQQLNTEEMIIKDNLNQYTESFTALMKPYYLHL